MSKLLTTSVFGALAAFALGPAWSQDLGELGAVLPPLDLRGQGWSQLGNADEMVDYLLALVEIAVLTFLVCSHPSIRHSRKTRADFERPRILFIYGLIGMTIGFLVLHHGYIIGFVVFGIGGFLRFRSESTSMADTSRLILMSLLGLCIGLDLPVFAFLATVSGWVVIYFFSRQEKIELEVRLPHDESTNAEISQLVEVLAERGFRTLAHTKSKFKSDFSLVIEPQRGLHRDDLMRHIAEIHTTREIALDDWHIN